jgi:hypothetical protein
MVAFPHDLEVVWEQMGRIFCWAAEVEPVVVAYMNKYIKQTIKNTNW